jgi:hypothetical protein
MTKKEKKEPINITIGRLRAKIKLSKDKRALELLEKISEEILEKGIL